RNKENMIQAVTAVRSQNTGNLKIDKTFGVPRATLFRLCKKDSGPDVVSRAKLGRKPALSNFLKRELVKYCLNIEKPFDGLTRKNVCDIAFQLARRNNIPNPLLLLRQPAGKDWLYHFRMRHNDILSLRRPTDTPFARATGFNKENVDKLFDILET
ncbi:hypothetical protein ILUMI_01748, partial [Ignelater luminosus]